MIAMIVFYMIAGFALCLLAGVATLQITDVILKKMEDRKNDRR